MLSNPCAGHEQGFGWAWIFHTGERPALVGGWWTPSHQGVLGLGGYPVEQAVGVGALCSEVRGLGNGLGLIGKCSTGHVLLSMLEYRTCIALVNYCWQ